MLKPTLDVAVNIVRRADGRVLLAERTPRQISAGFWELPGGKVDPGESPAEAARRELAEEIGIRAVTFAPAIRYDHAFRTRRLRLHFFRVAAWEGTPHGREGQRIAWVDPTDPDVAPILPSNERVLLALGLPAHYAVLRVTGSVGAALQRLPALLDAGVRLIGVDAPDLPADQRVLLARRVEESARTRGARVLVFGPALEARRAGVLGPHTTVEALARTAARPPVRLWIADCADERDLAKAIALGADAAVVADAGGTGNLARLVASASIPLYAAGAATEDALAVALRDGAIGIAAAA